MKLHVKKAPRALSIADRKSARREGFSLVRDERTWRSVTPAREWRSKGGSKPCVDSAVVFTWDRAPERTILELNIWAEVQCQPRPFCPSAQSGNWNAWRQLWTLPTT